MISNNIRSSRGYMSHDPYWNDVRLFLNNETGVYVDQSANAYTMSNTVASGGNGVVQASFSVNSNSGYSAYYDGKSYMYAPIGLQLGAGDYTVEGWFYWSAQTGLQHNQNQILFASRNTSAGTNFWVGINCANSTVGYGNFVVNNTYSSAPYSSAPYSLVPLNSWTHIAACRFGTLNTLYKNGQPYLTVTSSSNLTFSSAFGVGGNQYIATNYDDYFRGYIDDFRVTVGYCRYKTAFTPPIPPLPKA